MASDSFGRAVVEAVGGAGNISSVEACFTRVRLRLVDPSRADTASVEKVPDVLGVYWTGERLDVLVGPSAIQRTRDIRALLNGD